MGTIRIMDLSEQYQEIAKKIDKKGDNNNCINGEEIALFCKKTKISNEEAEKYALKEVNGWQKVGNLDAWAINGIIGEDNPDRNSFVCYRPFVGYSGTDDPEIKKQTWIDCTALTLDENFGKKWGDGNNFKRLNPVAAAFSKMSTSDKIASGVDPLFSSATSFIKDDKARDLVEYLSPQLKIVKVLANDNLSNREKAYSLLDPTANLVTSFIADEKPRKNFQWFNPVAKLLSMCFSDEKKKQA